MFKSTTPGRLDRSFKIANDSELEMTVDCDDVDSDDVLREAMLMMLNLNILEEECQRRGLPVSAEALMRHIENNHAATIGAYKSTINILNKRIKELEPKPTERLQASFWIKDPYYDKKSSDQHCPDNGACHHDCKEICFRVECCDPLSPWTRWPDRVLDNPCPVQVPAADET